MIAWSIDAAMLSGCFDSIIVSTEDPEIAKVAIDHNVEVLARPEELATDSASLMNVMHHAAENTKDPLVCCVYATAPFLNPYDLQCGAKLISEYEYVYSATEFPHPIERAIVDGKMIQPEHWNTRSQDCMEAYYDAGQFYWGHRDCWLQEKVIFTKKSKPIMIPRSRAQDVNTPEDWAMAEAMGFYNFDAIYEGDGNVRRFH